MNRRSIPKHLPVDYKDYKGGVSWMDAAINSSTLVNILREKLVDYDLALHMKSSGGGDIFLDLVDIPGVVLYIRAEEYTKGSSITLRYRLENGSQLFHIFQITDSSGVMEFTDTLDLILPHIKRRAAMFLYTKYFSVKKYKEYIPLWKEIMNK